MAAPAATAISPLLFPTSLHGGNTPPGLTKRWVLWLCLTLIAEEKPSKCPWQLVVTTPAHQAQSFWCHHVSNVTAVPWDRVTSSNSGGKGGGLLCFLQPLHFWGDPCFSTSSILANLLSGNENFQRKRL